MTFQSGSNSSSMPCRGFRRATSGPSPRVRFFPLQDPLRRRRRDGPVRVFRGEAHPHLRCQSFDLPQVAPIATRKIEQAGLAHRVTAVGGDFFSDPLPKADVITMGMILHDWNLERKKLLIGKVYDALPDGGAFVAIEALIDDARRSNAFGLLMSLNMLIEFGDAFDFTNADFVGWCREAGFRRFEVIKLAGPSSAAVAYK